jgi:hypothetical protein
MIRFCFCLVTLMMFIFNNILLATEVKITGIEELDLSQDLLVYVSANAEKGFNFPYYLFIPRSINRNQDIHILTQVASYNFLLIFVNLC